MPVGSEASERFAKLRPLLERAVYDSVNAWFQNILTLRESDEVSAQFYKRLAQLLRKSEYAGFRKHFGDVDDFRADYADY